MPNKSGAAKPSGHNLVTRTVLHQAFLSDEAIPEAWQLGVGFDTSHGFRPQAERLWIRHASRAREECQSHLMALGRGT